jgi:hypothetical protein
VWWVKYGGLVFQNQQWYVYVSMLEKDIQGDVINQGKSVLAAILYNPAEYAGGQNFTCVYNSAFNDDSYVWISTSPISPTLMANIFE